MSSNIDLSKLSVLVIDSNQHNLGLAQTILRSIGVGKATTTSQADVALEKLSAGAYDIAIVDMDFSDCMDSMELIRMARSGDGVSNPGLPIIMIAAQPSLQQVMAARDAGIHEFLRRPFSPAELHQRIMAIVRNPRKFVRASKYAGPDRRRTRTQGYAGPERRAAHRAREKTEADT